MMKKFTVIKTYIHEINEIGYGRELLGSFGKNGAEAINFARKNVDEGGGGIVYIAFESSENDIEIFTCKKDFPKDAVVVEIPVDETWTPEWAWKAMPERFTPAPCVK